MGIRERAHLMRWAFCAIVIGIALYFAFNYVEASDLPTDRSAVEDQLDREVYGYLALDGTGWVATRFGDKIIFDHLILDPNPMGIPPEPRWQWSGDWTAIPVTSDAASAKLASGDGTRVLFGQVNDPSIVSVQIETSETSSTLPIHGEGYLLSLDGLSGTVQQVRFLDEAGNVVYEVDV